MIATVDRPYSVLVPSSSPSKLPVRWGCALAFAISASIVAAVAVGFWMVSGRELRADDWGYYLFQIAIIGIPFAALAVARTRDWLAWLLAVAFTAAVWGYYLYDLTRNTGVNFILGPVMMIAAPVVISGLCLAAAGMRDKIPDWGREPGTGQHSGGVD